MPEATEVTHFKPPAKKCKRCDQPKELRFGMCSECQKLPRTQKTASAPAKPVAENSVKLAGGENAKGSGGKQGSDGELSGGAVAAIVGGAVVVGGLIAFVAVPFFFGRKDSGGAMGAPSFTVVEGGRSNG